MSVWICLVFASLLSCAGQLCQKQATRPSKSGRRGYHILGWLGLALLSLGCSMLLWLSVLQSIPVSIAYPMLSLNFVWVTLAAWGSGASRSRVATGLAWDSSSLGSLFSGAVSDGLNLGVVQRRHGERRAAAAAQRDGRAPPLTEIFTFLNHLLHLRAGTFGLGVRAYGLPAVDGLLVLRPPSTAAGESLRAAEPELHLVWAAAIWLPGWHEPFHWQSLLGVLLIVAGVLTIFWPVKRQG